MSGRKKDEESAGVDGFVVDLGGGVELAVISLPDGTPRASLDALTPTERLLVDSLLLNVSIEEIATTRRRSTKTVRNQVAAIYKKLGVSSRSELVALVSGNTPSRPPS